MARRDSTADALACSVKGFSSIQAARMQSDVDGDPSCSGDPPLEEAREDEAAGEASSTAEGAQEEEQQGPEWPAEVFLEPHEGGVPTVSCSALPSYVSPPAGHGRRREGNGDIPRGRGGKGGVEAGTCVVVLEARGERRPSDAPPAGPSDAVGAGRSRHQAAAPRWAVVAASAQPAVPAPVPKEEAPCRVRSASLKGRDCPAPRGPQARERRDSQGRGVGPLRARRPPLAVAPRRRRLENHVSCAGAAAEQQTRRQEPVPAPRARGGSAPLPRPREDQQRGAVRARASSQERRRCQAEEALPRASSAGPSRTSPPPLICHNKVYPNGRPPRAAAAHAPGHGFVGRAPQRRAPRAPPPTGVGQRAPVVP
nr:serine/arginine repetitive matrix protein 3-like [Penaeus vannamei]